LSTATITSAGLAYISSHQTAALPDSARVETCSRIKQKLINSERREMTKPTDNKDAFNWMLNVAYAIAFAAMGFIIQIGFSAQQELGRRVDEMPEKYILKMDYKSDQERLVSELQEIKQAIKHNAEYMESDYNRRMDKLEKLLQESLKK